MLSFQVRGVINLQDQKLRASEERLVALRVCWHLDGTIAGDLVTLGGKARKDQAVPGLFSTVLKANISFPPVSNPSAFCV